MSPLSVITMVEPHIFLEMGKQAVVNGMWDNRGEVTGIKQDRGSFWLVKVGETWWYDIHDVSPNHTDERILRVSDRVLYGVPQSPVEVHEDVLAVDLGHGHFITRGGQRVAIDSVDFRIVAVLPSNPYGFDDIEAD